MKVLIACEFSGRVREAFKAKGHDAWSCDLLPTEIPGQHIQDDVLKHLNDGWDMMIAHDPCTYQCNSGVRWLAERPERYELLAQSCEFTKQLLEAPIEKICRENPLPHKYALYLIGVKYSQAIQPYMFGEPYTKLTCLWLKNLPPLIATLVTFDRYPAVHREPPSEDRWKNRSRTYPGIANAMAEQWG